MKAPLVCKACGRKITTAYETLFGIAHFHNSPAQPCFYGWLKRQLKIAVNPGK